MSSERGHQGHCVLCSSELITAVVSKRNQGNISGMKYQLRTLFVLRKLLGISNSTCCDLLQFGNPSTWLSYCFECFETVIEAEKVFSKLEKLERKWTALKKSVEEEICKQEYSSQITQKFSDVRNAEIIHRIQKEVVDRLQSLNQKFDSPTINSAGVKIENNEEEDFDKCASPDLNDYQSSEEDNTMTQSSTNSVLQNNENQEQGRSRVEVSTPELTVNKLSKNQVGGRSRTGRLIKSKYGSDLNGDNVKDEYQPNCELVGNEDNNLLEPIDQSKNIQCSQCDRVFQHPYGLHYHKLRYHKTDSEKRFRCELCGMGMTARSSLFRHMEKQHAGQTATGPRSCYKCSSHFSTKSELLDHLCESTNKIQEVMEYQKSDKNFNTAGRLESHATSEGKVKFTERSKLGRNLLFKCHNCSRAFSSLTSRRRHTLRTHGKEKPYPCGKCEIGFYTSKSLLCHDKKSHSGPPLRSRKMNPADPERRYREKTFPCPHCEFLFTSENVVECHIRQVHDSNFNIPCTVCSRQFATTIRMKKHLRNVHHKEKNFICEICSKSFVYSNTLRHHQMSKHEKSELLKCKQCDHCAASTESLKKHIAVIHNKSSLRFKCPVCSHVAISQSSLNAHILGRHTNEKPFACTECDKSYVSSSQLRIHKRSHTGEKPFECRFCQKRFCDTKYRRIHEEDMHSTEKLFQCEKCGKNFPSKSYLKTHDYGTHRKKQKYPVPEKVLINNELLKEAISQNTVEIVKTNMVGLMLEKSVQKHNDT